MKDPLRQGRKAAEGFQPNFAKKLDQLLGLPGDLRPQALVMICFHLRWLFAVDPNWTERQLLGCANDNGSDGDAFWGGVLWAAQTPSRDLFLKLKSGLLQRAAKAQSRRGHSGVIAGFLLTGWGGEIEKKQQAQSVTDIELREILINADDEFRGRMIWQLSQWSAVPGGWWHGMVIPFLRRVWPKQRSLRTASVSARLTDFALASGDLVPEVVELIIPRIVPVRGPALGMLALKPRDESYPPRRYPRATLDLLWAALAEDPTLWPYQIEVVLEELAQMPETSGDPRLSELRRRRET